MTRSFAGTAALPSPRISAPGVEAGVPGAPAAGASPVNALPAGAGCCSLGAPHATTIKRTNASADKRIPFRIFVPFDDRPKALCHRSSTVRLKPDTTDGLTTNQLFHGSFYFNRHRAAIRVRNRAPLVRFLHECREVRRAHAFEPL